MFEKQMLARRLLTPVIGKESYVEKMHEYLSERIAGKKDIFEHKKPEKFLSKETLAEIIGTGIADLPVILVAGGVGSSLTRWSYICAV